MILCLLLLLAQIPSPNPPTPEVDTAALSPDAPALPPETPAAASDVLPGEAHIRAGIVLLAKLNDLLTGVQDEDTAEAACAPLLKLTSELQEWGQRFSALPPPSRELKIRYEQQYMPVIKAVNRRIKTQGERIAAAEYYNNRDLLKALISMVRTLQKP